MTSKMECHGCQHPVDDEELTRVCRHIALGIHEGYSCGFFFDESLEAERGDAWCVECESRRARDEGRTEGALEDTGMCPVCAACYDEARRQNGPWGATFAMSPERLLADCIQNVGTGPRRFAVWQRWGYLRARKPRWAYLDDDIRPFYNHYQAALRRGRVTWGAMVQAHPALFGAGRHNHPGEVVYVADPSIPVDLIELRRVAQRLVALKGARPADPRFAIFSAYLADEITRVFGLQLPESVSPKLPCAVSTVVFNRAHLPNRMLRQNVFPVVVAADPPHVAVVLPSRFWPDRFLTFWVEG